MTGDWRRYAVDRLEGRHAILIGDDDGQPVEVPLAPLPFRVHEAWVLAVPLDSHGRPQWERARRDEAEERRRLAEGQARLERLNRRDPGGDIGV
jgi:hypothetical protein